ncbi:MAG: MBL fold metallo-hydrolase [Spirochaetales bacterium]|nr:MBL fold metallo-hydrolase [Spirochaetales bacterium]
MVEKIVVGLFSTNSYLYSIWKKECLVIDPGGDTEKIIRQMVMKNMKPKAIILTHGHFDHILAVGELQDYFREKDIYVPIAIHKEDTNYIGPSCVKAHQESLHMFDPEYADKVSTTLINLPMADIILEDGQKIDDTDLEVIHTPGHTKGSICLYSESTQTLFSGDTLFFESIGRTDMKGGSHRDIIESLRNRIMLLPPVTRVYPGHGPITTIEREMSHNPFMAGV